MDHRGCGVDDVHMPGQDGRASTSLVVGTSVLAAAVLAAAVGVAALRSDTASADTVLTRGDGAVLELADGTSRPAVVGERVPRGATVRAGRTGAELQTREREVWLGGATAVQVLDGARQQLRDGFVLVDASDAPGLELQTAAGTVTTQDDSLVRVDDGSLLRVGVLRGAPAAVRAAGRRATAEVATYFQVQMSRGGLPGSLSPFVLTPGDAYERQLAADLVRADDDLNALASRLDADGAVGRAVLTALDEDVETVAGVQPGAGSEGAVSYLIARATGAGDVAATYTQVRELRADGGSWGIVAAIVAAPVDQVSAALSALLDPGTVPVVASRPLDVDVVLDLGGSGGEPGDPDGPAAPRPPSEPQPEPTGGSVPPTDGPTPPPSSGPLAPVTDVVEDVVDTVRDVIDPSPTPSPTSSTLVDSVLDPVVGPVLDPLLSP
jgi:hypothetical protein